MTNANTDDAADGRARGFGDRLRSLAAGSRSTDQHAVGGDSPALLAGEWDLIALTSGFFERPRLDSAHLVISPRNDREMDCNVVLSRNARTLRMAAVVPLQPDSRGLYLWRGRGPMFVARSKWGIACSADGSVAAVHHPASMSSDAGAVIILRSEIDPQTARRRVEGAITELRLGRSDFRDLSWRL